MTGFEPGSSGIVSDRSANCATTTSHGGAILLYSFRPLCTGNSTMRHRRFPELRPPELFELTGIGCIPAIEAMKMTDPPPL